MEIVTVVLLAWLFYISVRTPGWLGALITLAAAAALFYQVTQEDPCSTSYTPQANASHKP